MAKKFELLLQVSSWSSSWGKDDWLLDVGFHSHLPYVAIPEYDEFLEEDWFFEALTETYIPLLDVFEG